ncbi:sigma 54-interacting transcriptional regulator [Burkholderiaceae bacterium FT117]|uniref:sigma-54 interaction domain-containing protein n=1 Tax=Zeimonas sediminis TaxID=2944268 RepID=UPI0023431259|nr:sigma 54-interacting transcriptional regulator [Zeimonas sediminis]MCM5571158.1 sigma 54-interacting transcriptional regulator [Zeimonas sediminis]
MPRTLEAWHDSDRLLRLAAQTFFDQLSEMCEGILVVDKAARIVWIDERWQRNIQSLGFNDPGDVIGRPVEEIVPNTLMRHVVETGKPILLDILENKAGTYIVSRFPVHDEAGEVIGAVGLILYDRVESLKPLMGKLSRLQAELAQAQSELARQRRTRYTFSNFVGNSERALDVKSRARRAAVLNTTVLLLGETGTGKELLAQAIHSASSRARHPFIAVNVAAIPDTLLEAEFFGVAPGAYTGADKRGRDGKFRLADGGTLFLDEIGDMPLGLQAKLLRALQEREFEPLGSNAVVRFDARVIAASSIDLGQLVEQGRFRADLYYRLNVLPIRLPPLRERVEDLEPLCEHLLEQIALDNEMQPKEIDRDAIDALARLPWKGNVRELRNVLERACSLWDGIRLTLDAFRDVLPEIGAEPAGAEPGIAAPAATTERAGIAHAVARGGPVAGDPRDRPANAAPSPVAVHAGADDPPPEPAAPHASLAERIAQLERAAIRDALRATGGNRLQAARRLGIARATLYLKLEQYPEISSANAEVAASAADGARR